jgi:uncharacterized protein (DUF488 family)
MQPGRAIYTIGHSTRSTEELIALLREHAIELLVDVRRYPASRRNPQFAQDALSSALNERGIAYRHEIDLGGRRRASADSPNRAWQNVQFRGYADHTASEEFESALTRLVEAASSRATAVMCAEAHPSRCHRRIVADVLVARGWRVVHILDRGRAVEHVLDANARVTPRGKLVYPAPQSDLGFA